MQAGKTVKGKAVKGKTNQGKWIWENIGGGKHEFGIYQGPYYRNFPGVGGR